jgi:hypothetical protein
MAWSFDPDESHAYWTGFDKQTGLPNAPEGRKHVRHCEEIAKACRMFDALQRSGLDIFDATGDSKPLGEMNRNGANQTVLRKLCRQSFDVSVFAGAREVRRAAPEPAARGSLSQLGAVWVRGRADAAGQSGRDRLAGETAMIVNGCRNRPQDGF